MFSGEKKFKVFNKCHYDVGVMLMNGMGINIRSGSFQLISADDILYIESICNARKFFSSKMLVAVDEYGKEVDITEFGLYKDELSEQHYSKEEIVEVLKGTAKKIETFLDSLNDPTEIDLVYKTAMEMDLPSGKLKILKAKIPNKEFI